MPTSKSSLPFSRENCAALTLNFAGAFSDDEGGFFDNLLIFRGLVLDDIQQNARPIPSDLIAWLLDICKQLHAFDGIYGVIKGDQGEILGNSVTEGEN